MTAIMETSDDITAIAKVLPKAQADMGEVFKTANNPAFKSKYADLAAVVEAVVPALNKHGITLLQPISFNGDLVHVGTVLLHESGQWIRCVHSIPLSKRDAHGIGSATTYGRRQGLSAMAGVAPEDDDGNAASGPRQPTNEPKAAPKPPTLAERAGRLTATLQAVKTKADLERAYSLASALRAELDDKEPDILADLDRLFAARLDALQDIAA
jgi:hypothetical protein